MNRESPTDWNSTTVGNACRIRNDLRLPISREERAKMQGPYPYYGPTGQLDAISDYRLDGTFALIGEDGDHFLEVEDKPQTILVSGKFNVNNHAHVIESTNHCIAEWFYNYFRHKCIKPFLTRQGAGRYKLNKAALKELPIGLPPIEEQEAINALFRKWDTAIQKTAQLITAKEQHYSHELSRLIGQSRHPHDHIGNFAKEVSERNRGGNEARVLSVTNSRGFVLPEDQFKRRVASANLSNYKIVRQGQYAYNPSRVNVGSIARLDNWDEGVLSPMYVVFRLDEAKVDSDYFSHWLNSNEARYRIANSAQGSVRQTVSFKEFAAIQIPLPERSRQTRIARYLNALRKEIDLLKAYRGRLQKQKRGLMQKLLTGQWRIPEHRIDQEEQTSC